MGFLLVPLLGLATVLGVLGLAVTGVANLVVGIHHGLRGRQWLRLLTEGGIELLLAVLLIWAPFVAADHSERRNDWVDVDSNGMLDPMTNGSYDWVDVNGGEFGWTWAVLAAVMAIPSGLALYALSKLADPSDRGR